MSSSNSMILSLHTFTSNNHQIDALQMACWQHFMALRAWELTYVHRWPCTKFHQQTFAFLCSATIVNEYTKYYGTVNNVRAQHLNTVSNYFRDILCFWIDYFEIQVNCTIQLLFSYPSSYRKGFTKIERKDQRQ